VGGVFDMKERGAGKIAHLLSPEELERRRALVPPDTRDHTGRLLGDPIPGDERRQLFPGEDEKSPAWNKGFYRAWK
jgi:hypothetical protein